jgi:hypothetical protein
MKTLETSEHEIQNSIIAYLTMRGHKVTRVNSGAVQVGSGQYKRFIKLADKGTSDLIVCEKGTGRYVAIEIKKPGKKADILQQYFLNEVNELGGKGFVATSIDDVQKEGL